MKRTGIPLAAAAVLTGALYLLPGLHAQSSSRGWDGGRYPFALVGADQGIPTGTVISLAQDIDGFIWLGTENGLIRYEGRQYRKWTKRDGLVSSWIRRVAADPEGGVWVGTLQGLMRFRDGRFESALFDQKPSDSSIYSLTFDGESRIWVASRQGVFRQEKDLLFQKIPWPRSQVPNSLAYGYRSGRVYFSADDGIHAMADDLSLRSWGRENGLPEGNWSVAAEDGLGRVWAGCGRSLYMKEPGSDSFSDRSLLLPAAMTPNNLPVVDLDGSVWIPTLNGILHVSGNQTEVIDTRSGLPFRWVRSLIRDRDGTLWVIGSALSKLRGNGRLKNYTMTRDPYGQVVWQILLDAKTKQPITGTDEGAVRIGIDGPELIEGTQGLRIKDLLYDGSQTLWMVSSTGPTLWLNPGENRAQTAPLGEYGSRVNTIYEDSGHSIWMGHTEKGILRWDRQRGRLARELAPDAFQVSALGVYSFQEDPLQRLWAASSAGLLVLLPETGWRRFTEKDGLKSSFVRGMAFQSDGDGWLFYQEPLGLTRFRLQNDRLEILEDHTGENGLSSDAVYSVAVDSGQQVWAGTDQGLNRLNPPLQIGHQDGMISEDCAIGALLVDQNRVWVGTANGLVRYDSSEFPPPSLASLKTHLVEVRYGDRVLEPPFPSLDPLQGKNRDIQFRIAAPYYRDEHAITLQVRLVGLEKEWRKTPSAIIRYPNLPGGRYRFQFQAAGLSGSSGILGEFVFSVRPRWWQSWWGIGLFTLLGVLLMLLIVRLRIASLARSKAELESLVAERTKLLNHRNEELTRAMANIKQLSGLLPICARCKKIRDDKGYWNNLEYYISSHTDADFTHSICPSCMKDLYPDLVDENDPQLAPGSDRSESGRSRDISDNKKG